MKLSMFTFSRAELIEACPWVASDLAPDRPKADFNSEDAALGKAFHRVAASTINQPPPTSPAYVIDKALRDEGLDADKFRMRLIAMQPAKHALFLVEHRCTTAQAEVTFAYDLSTGSGREVGKDLGRDYSLARPGELIGTADTVHSEPDPDDGTQVMIIGDWKVGPMAKQTVTPVERNKQLGLLAMTAFNTYNPEKVKVELRFVNDDGDILVLSHTYDSTGIAEIDVWLGEQQERIAAATGPTPGKHCTDKYCPLLSVCPAVQKDVDKVVALALTQEQKLPIEPTMLQRNWPLNVISVEGIQSAEHAALLLARYKAVKALCMQGIKAVQGYTDKNGDIPLGNGKVYGLIEKRSREIKAPTVEKLTAVLAPFLPVEDQATLIYATAPLTKLCIAVKSRASDPDKAAATERAALSALRKEGFIEDTMGSEHRDHRPKKTQVDDDPDADE